MLFFQLKSWRALNSRQSSFSNLWEGRTIILATLFILLFRGETRGVIMFRNDSHTHREGASGSGCLPKAKSKPLGRFFSGGGTGFSTATGSFRSMSSNVFAIRLIWAWTSSCTCRCCSSNGVDSASFASSSPLSGFPDTASRWNLDTEKPNLMSSPFANNS